MQLGPWGLVHHQKACTLRIDYVNYTQKYIIVANFDQSVKFVHFTQNYNGLHFKYDQSENFCAFIQYQY